MTLLAQARNSRGWSSTQLRRKLRATADGLDVTISSDASLRVQLSRWENGHHSPDAIYRRLLEVVFDLPAAALGLDEDRDPAGVTPALLAPRRSGAEPPPAVVEYFANQLAEHARLDNLAGPGYVVATATGQLAQIEQLAAGSPAMTRLAARFAEFTGWLHQDTGRTDAGLRLTERSIDLAESASDAELATYNLMRKSNLLTAAGDAQLAAHTARKALAAARQQHPTLRPVCLRQHALTAAHVGDTRSALDSLDEALALTDRAISPAAGLSPYCTRSYVQMEAALCLLSLRRPADAERACADALADWPDTLLRDQTLCHARRAVALAELNDVEEACRAAQLGIEGVRSAPSGRAIHMLRKVATRLRPFSRNPSVRELTEALATVA